jgi:hypothetical protein
MVNFPLRQEYILVCVTKLNLFFHYLFHFKNSGISALSCMCVSDKGGKPTGLTVIYPRRGQGVQLGCMAVCGGGY